MLINPITPNYNNQYKPQTFTGHTMAEFYGKKGIRYLAHQTAFFREPVTLERVKSYITKNFADKKEINILVGACSTGEEAYSLSLLLKGLKNKVNIIGFDLSPKAIDSARKGKVLMQTSIVDSEKDTFLKDSYLVFDDKNNLSKRQQEYRTLFEDTFEPINSKFYKFYNNIKRAFEDLNPNIGRKSRYFKLKDDKINNCRFIEGDIRELDKLDAPKQVDVLFFRNAFYHLLDTVPRTEEKEEVLTKVVAGIRQKLGRDGIFVNGEDDGIRIKNEYLIPRVMRKMGFEPVNPKLEDDYYYTASIWKKLEYVFAD